MFSSRRAVGARRTRGSRSRHGRALRSSAAGPHLPQLTGRIPRFMQSVEETLGFLRAIAPEPMNDVGVGVAPLPAGDHDWDGQRHWHIVDEHSVVLYRVLIERAAKLSLSEPKDQILYREYVERTVIAAVNDLLNGELDSYLAP